MTFTRKLVRTEWRLFLREPLAMAFVVAFPVITALVIGGVFDDDDPAFGGRSRATTTSPPTSASWSARSGSS